MELFAVISDNNSEHLEPVTVQNLALLMPLYYQGIRRMEEVTSDVAQLRGGNSHYMQITPQLCAVAKKLADKQW